jgi:hypothetical protein
MKKSILLILIFFFILVFYPFRSEAQMEGASTHTPFINRLKVGLRFGPAWGIPSSKGDKPFDILNTRIPSWGGTEDAQVARLGTTVGVYGVAQLKKNISWRTEISFLSKHSRDYYDLTTSDSLGIDTYGGNTYYSFNYLELPNMISFQAPWYTLKPYFSVGLSPSILINATKKDIYHYFSGSDGAKSTLMAAGFPFSNHSSKVSANRFNLAFVLAAGNNIRLSKSLQLNFEIRHYFDLMKAFDYSYGARTAQINFMTFTLQTGLIYSFSKNNELITKREKKYLQYKTRQLKEIPIKEFPLNHLCITTGRMGIRIGLKDVGGGGVYTVTPTVSHAFSFGVLYVKNINNKFFAEGGANVAWNNYYFDYVSPISSGNNNLVINNTLDVPIGIGIQKDLFPSKRVKFTISAGPKFHFILKGLSSLDKNDTVASRSNNGQFSDAVILHGEELRVFNPGAYLKTSVYLRLSRYKFLSFSLIGQYYFGKPILKYEIYQNGMLSDYGNLNARNQNISFEIAYSFLQLKTKKKKR